MWIWEDENYPNFTYDKDAVAATLESLTYHRGALLAMIRFLEERDVEHLQVENIVNDACSTFEIEGEILSRDSVRSSIKKRLGIQTDIYKRNDLLAENIVDVLLDAVSLKPRADVESLILGYHAALFPSGFSSFHKIRTGTYRTEEIQVVSGRIGKEKVHYVAPEHDKVDEEMKRFHRWFEQCEPTAVNAAIAHLWFLIIHPFDDGNGRLARIISDMVCAKMDRTSLRLYSVSETILQNRKAYYDVLERTTARKRKSAKPMTDITEWVTWFLTVLDASVKRSVTTVNDIVAKKKFITRYFDMGLNERQRKVLLKVLDFGSDFEGVINTSKYKSIAGTSRATAVRDIQDLETKGILVRVEGKGGRSTAYVLNR